jgi:hypothetical protein
MRFAHNLEIRISKFENWNLRRRRLGRRLNPRAPKAFGVHGICREDFGIERNQSFKGDHGNAQFSLCCTSTAMPDDESQESTSGILFLQKNRIRKVGTQETAELAPTPGLVYTLFFNPRNMSGGKLPTAVALDQCVGELHNSIERFAVRCSFHTRFSENNG